MNIGEDPNYLYIDLPYLVGWKPLEERIWALKFIGEGGEDMRGFEAEFSQRFPELFKNGSPAYIPQSVDYYLRHDSKGRRLDIDWALARVPASEEEKALRREARQGELRKRRMEALKERATRAKEAGEDVPEMVQRTLSLLDEIEGAEE
ncbi:hypothetical protein [uncultured Mediterranean phage]|nr:hypothetical protein [uncultured Mediterranean phage]